jgi:hypothetical protein
VFVGEAGHRRVVGHDGGRVGDGLGVDDPGRRRGDRGGDRGSVGQVDDVDAHAEARERVR